jgi:hypothetical protein
MRHSLDEPRAALFDTFGRECGIYAARRVINHVSWSHFTLAVSVFLLIAQDGEISRDFWHPFPEDK